MTDVVSSKSRSGQGMQHYVIKFVSALTCDRSGVFPVSSVSSTNKTYRHDVTEILLKVLLNKIKHHSIYYLEKFSLRIKFHYLLRTPYL